MSSAIRKVDKVNTAGMADWVELTSKYSGFGSNFRDSHIYILHPRPAKPVATVGNSVLDSSIYCVPWLVQVAASSSCAAQSPIVLLYSVQYCTALQCAVSSSQCGVFSIHCAVHMV